MSLVNEVRVVWDNGPGLPGTNVFHLDPSETSTSQLLDFYTALVAWIPTGITITVPGSGSTLNVENGELEGEWSAATGGDTTGTGEGDYAGGVGASVRWNTTSVVDGHRVRGRTFMVPLLGSCFDADGTLDADVQAGIAYQGSVVIDHYDGLLRVWHRPKQVDPKPAPKEGGSLHTVTTAEVADRASWLRSRRA